MTTLKDRPHKALLVIDAQKNVIGGAHDRDAVLANINTLIADARQAGVPVVWVQHSDDDMTIGSDGWQIVDELPVSADEPIVRKLYGDSFEATDLEQILAARGVGELVVTGAQSDACVRSTIHGAFTRGYDVTLVSDAHTTEDLTEWGAPPPDVVISHTNLYWQFQAAPGRTAAVKKTEEVAFA